MITNRACAIAAKVYGNYKRKKSRLTFIEHLKEAKKVKNEQPQNFLPQRDNEQHRSEQKKFNQDLMIASVSFGLSSIAALFYPPLTILSWPGFFYISGAGFIDSYNVFVEERKLGADAVASFIRLSLFFTGNFVLANLGSVIYAVNHKLLSRVKDNSKTTLIDVFKQCPQSVFVLSDPLSGELPDNSLSKVIEVEIAVSELKIGDRIVVNAGETIAVDGLITDGFATIDQQILTGEAKAVEKTVGDSVFASTLLLSGRVYIQVEKTGNETTVAQIGEILNQTIEFKTSTQLKAEKLTQKTAGPMLWAGLCLTPIWGIMPTLSFVKSHPVYKTTIAGSVSILSAINLASQQGILIKDGRTLELLNQIDTVVFDKTGTLTEEQPHVATVHTTHEFELLEVLRIAGAAEYKQSHPIAKAILAEVEAHQLKLPTVYEAEYKVGHGIRVLLNYELVRVGSVRFMETEHITISDEIRKIEERCHQEGHTLVLVALSNQIIGGIELHATVRPEAKEVISGLRKRGINQLYILSGDHEKPTKNLAQELGIDLYFAETLPEQKSDIIEQLHREGKSVCYVGDGINDSIALKRAKVSVSLRGASTVAIDTAQIILMDASLNQFCELFELSKQFNRNMDRTLALIFIPHAIAFFGTLFLNFSFIQVLLFTQASLYSGLVSGMGPLVKSRMEQRALLSHDSMQND